MRYGMELEIRMARVPQRKLQSLQDELGRGGIQARQGRRFQQGLRRAQGRQLTRWGSM